MNRARNADSCYCVCNWVQSEVLDPSPKIENDSFSLQVLAQALKYPHQAISAKMRLSENQNLLRSPKPHQFQQDPAHFAAVIRK